MHLLGVCARFRDSSPWNLSPLSFVLCLLYYAHRMHISQFDFTLPQQLIAQYPLVNRTESRLLSLNPHTGSFSHNHFFDLPDLLKPNDLLVFNNTKVIPARLFGIKESGGKVEILVERALNEKQFLAQIKASKTPKKGSRLLLEEAIDVLVVGREDNFFILQTLEKESIFDLLEKYGHVPLPPYINRADEIEDKNRYQTVYAERKGAVAAPTAGLHFDETLINDLQKKGIDTAFVTLHVGAGTFQPVRVTNIFEHKMHAEFIEVSKEVCEKVKIAKQKKGRIIAVGTTSVRALESAALQSGLQGKLQGELKPFKGDTHIFIYPGYSFNVIDGMITNFHLPKSSLIMLVAAFAGLENIKQAYRVAIDKRYRFFSYGDAMVMI